MSLTMGRGPYAATSEAGVVDRGGETVALALPYGGTGSEQTEWAERIARLLTLEEEAPAEPGPTAFEILEVALGAAGIGFEGAAEKLGRELHRRGYALKAHGLPRQAEEAIPASNAEGFILTTLRGLEPGDILRHRHAASAVLVTGNYGDRVTAVRTFDISNPREWRLIRKAAR